MKTYDFMQAYEAMKHGLKVVPLGTTNTVLHYDAEKEAVVLNETYNGVVQSIIMPMVSKLIDAQYVAEGES